MRALTSTLGVMGSYWGILSRGVPQSDFKWTALTAVIQAKDDGSLTRRIGGEFLRHGRILDAF